MRERRKTAECFVDALSHAAARAGLSFRMYSNASNMSLWAAGR